MFSNPQIRGGWGGDKGVTSVTSVTNITINQIGMNPSSESPSTSEHC